MPILRRLFGSPPRQAHAEAIYAAVVAQSRQPRFYADWQVPDTIDGRFEMVALHTVLVLRRLKRVPDPGPALAQTLFDTMFADMDRSLREMGVGDLGVGRRVKAMAKGFYGRIAAYDAALAGLDSNALDEALRRNVYGTLRPPRAVTVAVVESLSGYVRASATALEQVSDQEILAGMVRFAAL